jgi:hypothetical protein
MSGISIPNPNALVATITRVPSNHSLIRRALPAAVSTLLWYTGHDNNVPNRSACSTNPLYTITLPVS